MNDRSSPTKIVSVFLSHGGRVISCTGWQVSGREHLSGGCLGLTAMLELGWDWREVGHTLVNVM